MADIPLELGDRFVESYYSARWYNCYEVHDHVDDRIKCWYYNLAYPAEITANTVSFRDLALDLLVYPDGRQQVLDEDEFEEAEILPDVRVRVLSTLQELQANPFK